MSKTDFIPESDAEFNLWQANLIVSVQASTTAWGILAADVTALVALQTPWTASFAKTSNPNNCTTADVQAKNDARRVYEKALRNFIGQWLARNAKVTDSDRTRLNITVKSASRTPVAVPSPCPVATIDFSVRLQHTIKFVDQTTPTSKAKPDGVHGCEVWCKVGDETTFRYLATDTATPYVASFDEADAGKLVSYHLRWVNTRGEQGPWSAVVSALVVG